MPPDGPAPLPRPDPPDESGRRGARTLQRQHGGSRLLGVRVSAIVVIELVAATVLLFRDVPVVAGAAIVLVAVALAAGALVPFRGMRLGTWLGGAAAYGTRRRVHTAVTPDRDDDGDTVAVPPEIAALFPGLAARETTSRGGEQVGLLHWQGRWHALLSITGPATDVLATNPAAAIPLERIVATLAGHGFELDALQVVTQALHGDTDRFGGGALAAVAAEHRAAGGFDRARETWIAVRIDPVRAAAPIAVRGGGLTGLGRLATAAFSRIEAEAATAGLVARPLDARTALRAMTDALLQPPAGADAGPARWIESWKSLGSAQTQHRCFAVKSWRERPLQSLALTAGYGLTVAHEITAAGDGITVVSVLRVSAASASQLDAASAQLREGCRGLGVGLRLLRGQQADAFRLTVPAGRR